MSNESTRVQYLHNLNILDTDFDVNFDRITKLLEVIFNVPIVLISLVDTKRQWFKSCIGLDVTETTREVSFCSDAIEKGDELYIVNDAMNHPKYKLNPLVTGNPKIRFYAGKPLLDNGYKLGTVCIIDRVPREITDTEKKILEICGLLVESEIKKMDYIKKIKDNEMNMKSISAIMSHELINTISSILCISEVMLMDKMFNKEEEEDVKIINDSAQNALLLSNDLLDNYKLELNQLKIEKSKIYLPDLVNTYKLKYGSQLIIEKIYDGYINADKCRIQQVLNNLFSNAIDFIDQQTGRIYLNAEKENDLIKFSVKDNGIGIPKEKISSLFKKFSENVNPEIKRSKPRTGLGLYICKEIIELHKGKIWLENENGTTFCFTIPII
jgi:signal transduction histidine kinase